MNLQVKDAYTVLSDNSEDIENSFFKDERFQFTIISNVKYLQAKNAPRTTLWARAKSGNSLI